MKKLYFLFVFTCFFLCCGKFSFGQIVGGNVFLQGTYLEIGENNSGSLGTCTTPAGYHAHCAACFGATSGLGEVFDYGHDGWGVGTPPLMGDYTQPGTPCEGWSLEATGTEYKNWIDGSPCTATPFNIAGSITSYSSAGASTSGIFSGGVAGISVIAETRVDQLASAVIFTVRMYNTTGATIPNVYYERMCDPDNASTWSGGSSTMNVIVHQNEDAAHDVLVSATADNPATFTFPPVYLGNAPYTYMGLGTKDCRAVCSYFGTHGSSFGLGLAPAYKPDQLWSMAPTTGYSYTLHDSDFLDCGIALTYNLGNLLPFDSAAVSFAYIFNGNPGLDDAFPDPQLNVEGTLLPNAPVPSASYDTFDVCAHPGDDTVIVDILHATTGNWTWSHWTWAPSTGLTSTTGAVDTIISSVLPPSITYTITGTDSSGTGTMLNCQHKVFYLTILTCNLCVANSPCEGDTLYLFRKGDSTGCTYRWTGPAGFTSTLQDPFIFPSTLANAGEYHVIRTLLGVHDTDSVNVTIHPLPRVTASSNSPLCTSPLGTLDLFATSFGAGETFTWTGPDGFTSGLEDPTVPSFGPLQTGIYKVVTTSTFGCRDSATTDAELIPPPPAPVITGIPRYCQGETFVPFVVTDSFGVVLDSNLLWYSVPTGGTPTTTPLTANTGIPGLYTVYVSRKIGSCEGQRGSFTVTVVTTPPAPLVTGRMEYCQFVDTFELLTVHTTATGTVNWYTVSSGGTATSSEPRVNTNVAGVYNFWVSQTDSLCEGPRRPVTITVHPKPAPPVPTPQSWCQFLTPSPVAAIPASGLLWYGPGVTVGTSTPPTPGTLIAPDTIKYYVTETSTFGCVSDSAVDAVVIKQQPAPPVTNDISYCQGSITAPLNAEVDSAANSMLKWYIGGVLIDSTPVPPATDSTLPGNTTWYVTQTVNACESDSASVTVTILYTPVFSINASQPYVCQFDSISLSYSGPQLITPSYNWVLPEGASFAAGTHVYDSSIIVNFDSAVVYNYVKLTASADSGRCKSTDSVRITIESQPSAQAYTKPDVCLGDTVSLALASRAADAVTYAWYIDYIALLNSSTVSVISSSSNSGGPFSISWVDSGRHIIEVRSFSQDGCKSEPWYDTINVHMVPDAHFKIASTTQTGCLDDTVEFAANVVNYNNSYNWQPEHSFENINKPVAWGRIESAKTTITLTVTDPFGCAATESLELDPNSCCTVFMPNAFTPNGDGNNDYFRPVYNGYHRFHVFRVFNRWGQTVYESENNGMQWDGNWNGVPQDMGTYFYYLKYDCGGNTIEQKGDVTLIR